MSRRAVSLVAAAFFVTLPGCAGDEQEQGESIASAVPVHPLPRRVVDRCRAVPDLAPACPTSAPIGGWVEDGSRVFACRRAVGGCARGHSVFSFDWGGETPGRPVANRPRRDGGVVHVAVFAGDLGGRRGYQSHHRSAFPFDWPSRIAPLEDGLMKRERRHALLLARGLRWTGESAELVLAPPYGSGGLMGDHLILRWRKGSREYAFSLHAWEPLTEAAATLRRLVEDA